MRCQKIQLSCSYVSLGSEGSSSNIPTPAAYTDAEPGPHIELTQAGTKRRRVRRACEPCRNNKARCSGTQPCSRCESTGVECWAKSETTAFPSEGTHHTTAAHHSVADDGNLRAMSFVQGPQLPFGVATSASPGSDVRASPLNRSAPTLSSRGSVVLGELNGCVSHYQNS